MVAPQEPPGGSVGWDAGHPGWFVAGRRGSLYTGTAIPGPSRAVPLFVGLLLHLDGPVTVHLDDLRHARWWRADGVALEALGRAVASRRWLLARWGGVELTAARADEQVTLTPELAVVTQSVTPRWSYLLDGCGLEERAVAPPADWHWSRTGFRPAPECAELVQGLVLDLGLAPVAPPGGASA